MNTLINNYPDTFTFIQEHGSNDSWRITWEISRETFYGVTGYPTTVFDGQWQSIGAYQNDTQEYNELKSKYNTAIAVTCDTTVELTGDLVSGQTYNIHAKVTVDPGASSRTMRIYIANVLDNWPTSSDHRYRNCLRGVAGTQDVTLADGQSATIDRSFTFDSTSWAHQSDIRIIAWAQVPNASNHIAHIYNTTMMSWPFTPSKLAGDVNCDGLINSFDIDPFVACLATSTPTAPCTTCNNADINDDGEINAFDIDPFVDCVIAGGCP